MKGRSEWLFLFMNKLFKKILALFLFGCLFMGSFRSTAEARTIYVSSSIGSDSNDGYSPERPVKSITIAIERGDTLLLKAGDIFWGRTDFINKTVTRYGEGPNPTISGFKVISKPNWTKYTQNIWVLDLTGNNFSGRAISGSSLLNNIGCFHEIDKDVIHGRRVEKLTELKRDWDFWQKSNYKNATASDFDKLYLYYSGDPNELSLELSTGSSGSMVQNSEVSFVNFIGFGKHGIAAKNKARIHDCRIDMIGGMMFEGYSTFCCLGNGIEFYVNQDISDAEVRDCYISRCYDCGITIQASGLGRCAPRNIRIHHNLISHCCQGWEDFLCNDDDVVYYNCSFDNNTIVYSGDSGFDYFPERFKFCNVLGGNVKGDKGMTIKENVFYGGNFYCSTAFQGRYTSNNWINNKHYVTRGSYILGNYRGTADVLRIPIRGRSNKIIKVYRELTGDSSTRFRVKSEEAIERLSNKAIDNYLKNHTY